MKTTENQRPTHAVYAVVGQGADESAIAIGAAWPINGDGFGICLHSVPLSGWIVVQRPIDAEDIEVRRN